jgi:hypothetical protein
MEGPQNKQQFVRRLTLPSGRRIDVVYFEQMPEQVAPDSVLHVCGSCDCQLVQPIDWAPVGHSHWQVTLRCPNCEWTGTGVFSQEDVDRYDDQLEAGCQQLRRELDNMSVANMADEVERFVAALEADHIVPSDF